MAERTSGGYEIGDHFFPFVTRFKTGDPVLVEELTGLRWSDFLDRLPDEESPDDEQPDPVAMLGLLGCAVWRKNPGWRRDRVIKYVQSQEMEHVKAIAPEVADDDPPANPEAGSEISETTASGSASASDSSQEQ